MHSCWFIHVSSCLLLIQINIAYCNYFPVCLLPVTTSTMAKEPESLNYKKFSDSIDLCHLCIYVCIVVSIWI